MRRAPTMTAPEAASKPKRVGGIDAAFLHNETRSTPWHIVGVLVFDPSTAPEGFDTAVLRQVISDRLEQVEAFRRRVVDVRGALSVPHWVLDRTVDVTRHVQRARGAGRHRSRRARGARGADGPDRAAA